MSATTACVIAAGLATVSAVGCAIVLLLWWRMFRRSGERWDRVRREIERGAR